MRSWIPSPAHTKQNQKAEAEESSKEEIVNRIKCYKEIR
jgi:hypothetical protein